jgi:hypothetical protein
MTKYFEFSQADLLLTPSELIHKLCGRLNSLTSEQLKASNPIWTQFVKGFIGEIGEEFHKPQEHLELGVHYSGKGAGEYLVDIIWWCKRDTNQIREFMALAAEIEWSSWGPSAGLKRDEWVCARIGEDFGKLTVMKSPLKLMVFCTDIYGQGKSHNSMQDRVLKEIDRYLDKYAHHIPGEHYVFLDVASQGRHRAWVRSVSPSGALSIREELQIA